MTRRHIKPVLIGRETIPYDSAWYGEVGGGGRVGRSAFDVRSLGKYLV